MTVSTLKITDFLLDRGSAVTLLVGQRFALPRSLRHEVDVLLRQVVDALLVLLQLRLLLLSVGTGAGGCGSHSWLQRLDRISSSVYWCGASFVTDRLARFAYEPFLIFVFYVLDLVIAVVVHVRVVGKVCHTRFRFRCVSAATKFIEE